MGFTVSREVVAAARSGDLAALDTLLAELWPEAYRVSLGVLRDRDLAQDAAQDACASVAASIEVLRESAAFYPWFYRIVSRAATALAKRRTSHLPIEAAREAAEDRHHAERIDVLNALATLPLALRVPVVLHYYSGLNSREIGEALGAPSATIRFRMALAKRALRAKLEVHFPTPVPEASPDVC